MESIENNAKIKKFIEVQIKPGEKYDYEIIQKRFEKVLAKPENKELRKYCFILEKINKYYKSLIDNKNFEVSGWYVKKLWEFIGKYRQLRSVDNNKIPPIRKDGILFPHLNSNNKPIVNNKIPVRKSNIQLPPKFNLFFTPDIDRGTYYQEANTDEFGCVLVCGDK